MKHAAAETKNDMDLLQKIESIEKEIVELELFILEKLSPSFTNLSSFKMIFKGGDKGR